MRVSRRPSFGSSDLSVCAGARADDVVAPDEPALLQLRESFGKSSVVGRVRCSDDLVWTTDDPLRSAERRGVGVAGRIKNAWKTVVLDFGGFA